MALPMRPMCSRENTPLKLALAFNTLVLASGPTKAVIIVYLITLVFVAGLVRVAYRYWEPDALDEYWRSRRRFLVWAGKGILVPLLVWIFLKVGFSARLPALFPEIVVVRTAGGNWAALFASSSIPAALLLICSFWAATTLLWLVAELTIETECHRDLLGSCILWGVLLSPVTGLILYLGGWFGIGLATAVWLMPVARELLAIKAPQRISRPYASALAKFQAGKYTAAERAVLRALEKCEDDIQGWMILAELYAKHFNDLPEAGRIIYELCRQPNITRAQMSDALHRLADWHLRAGDAPAARRALGEICQAMPHSEFADVARRRVNQLTVVRRESRAEEAH